MTDRHRYIGIVLLVALLVYSKSGGALPSIVTPQATAVTYVYEQREHAVPSAVQAALNQLNRQGIRANLFDDDTRDGNGEVPDQYKAALVAALQAGLPALVVTAGSEVIRVVNSPLTTEQVLEAVR